MAELSEMLIEGETTRAACNLVVLTGIGGIGKTHIAVEYAYRAGKRYSSILWMDGSSEPSLLHSIRSIANAIKNSYERSEKSKESPHYNRIFTSLDSPELLKSAILTWLSDERNRNWLLIMDNVDDLESFDFQSFFPPSHSGSIIVTSRRSDLAVIWRSLEIQVMNEDEALELLERAAKIKLDPEASRDGTSSYWPNNSFFSFS